MARLASRLDSALAVIEREARLARADCGPALFKDVGTAAGARGAANEDAAPGFGPRKEVPPDTSRLGLAPREKPDGERGADAKEDDELREDDHPPKLDRDEEKDDEEKDERDEE